MPYRTIALLSRHARDRTALHGCAEQKKKGQCTGLVHRVYHAKLRRYRGESFTGEGMGNWIPNVDVCSVPAVAVMHAQLERTRCRRRAVATCRDLLWWSGRVEPFVAPQPFLLPEGQEWQRQDECARACIP